MKLTDYIVEYIKSQGIESVFGYTGGSIADLVDSICKSGNVRFIQNYNEQASSFCANSYAQVTGKTGIAISSSGPGAINMINGIANAYFDSVACLYITGNVHSLSKNTSKFVRQNAFQETDIVSMVKDITKYAVYLERAEDVKYVLEKAFYIAQEGRKGPVLIDIPYDIQRQEINPFELNSFEPEETQVNNVEVESFYTLLNQSKCPLILVGGGCQNARDELNDFIDKVQIPVVASMRGLDVVSHDAPYYIGFLGSYGNRSANIAIKYCDLLVVLGSRLDERQIGYRKNEFAPNAKIIQVDIDKVELGRKVDCVSQIRMDIKQFLEQIIHVKKAYDFSRWLNFLQKLKLDYPSITDIKKDYNAANFLYCLSKELDDKSIITLDVGQNQVIAAQVLDIKKDHRLLSSSGLACMGYSLPAAIGAYYANSSAQIVSINGDGGLQMNIQELETIAREKLPIKIVVLHNNALGLIRKLQEQLFNKRYYASVYGFSCPDLKKIAEAYDLDYYQIQNIFDYKGMSAFLHNNSSCLIDVILPLEMEAFPEPGAEISEQIPALSREEISIIEKQIKEIRA